jgi:hypothetical protein
MTLKIIETQRHKDTENRLKALIPIYRYSDEGCTGTVSLCVEIIGLMSCALVCNNFPYTNNSSEVKFKFYFTKTESYD